MTLRELGFELQDELLDDRLHHLRRQTVEEDDGVQPVTELRAEDALDGRLRTALAAGRLVLAEADRRGVQLARPGVRGHDHDDLPEIGLPAVIVRQGRVIHHLEQDVEDVRVRLLDLVEQQHGVGVCPHGVDEQPSLLEAHIAGWGADQSCHGMLLHVLAHVVADELVPQVDGQLLGQLGFPDPGRSGEQEAAGRMVRLTEPGPRALDRGHHGGDGVVLPEHHTAQRVVECAQSFLVRAGRLFLRDAGHPGDHALNVGRRYTVAGRGGGHPRDDVGQGRGHPGTRLVDHVDGAVREP